MTGRTYAIRVEGHLDDHWSPRLAGLEITHDQTGTSTLTGPIADQAELHGVLTGLRDIGAVLIDLYAVDAGQAQRGPARPGSRDTSIDLG